MLSKPFYVFVMVLCIDQTSLFVSFILWFVTVWWGYFFSFSAARNLRPSLIPTLNTARIISNDIKPFSSFRIITITPLVKPQTLLVNRQILNVSNKISPVPSRSVTKFSLKKGKRKTVKAVVRRFLRLHWGGWIRPKVGRHKKLWKKSLSQKRRLRQHVFCNGTQNTLLDKMVTKYWKRPKYYVEDPYTPYHTRDEYYITRKKPLVKNV